MKNLENDIAKQQEENITFVFQRQVNSLIVNAQTDKTLYCAKFQLTPNITADDLKECLESNNFKIIEKNSEVMKLFISRLVSLNFTSKDKLTIEELRSSIRDLNQKLQVQIQKNNQLCQNTVNLETRIRILEEKISRALSNLELLQDQVTSNIQQQSQNISSLNQTVEEHKARQLQKDNTFKQKIDQHSAELIRRSQLHEELKNELTNQINQNKKLMQTVDQEQLKKITTSTTQLTQLRTQFDQLITRTIPILMPYKPQFLKQSKVVNMHEEKLRISNFFENKTIKNVKLLYRASENEFSAAKFHEKCNGKENTLTLILTQFNIKIGGFTPLKWASPQSAEWVSDNSKESFIFSMTHNDQFTLQQPEKAIWNYSNYGPTFGGGYDLTLYDKSNSNNGSHANICKSYYNPKYKQGDSASYQRFHGGATGNDNFTTLEWEVWAVEWA